MSRKNNNYNANIIRTNRIAAIFALIIVIMWSFNLKDIREYEDIVIDRRSIADSVSTGSLALDKFEEDYQVCIQRMEALRESSQLGEFMADNDQKPFGRIVNYLVLGGSNCGMFCLCTFIMVNVAMEIVYAYNKGKRSYARMKKQKAQREKKNEMGVN